MGLKLDGHVEFYGVPSLHGALLKAFSDGLKRVRRKENLSIFSGICMRYSDEIPARIEANKISKQAPIAAKSKSKTRGL